MSLTGFTPAEVKSVSDSRLFPVPALTGLPQKLEGEPPPSPPPPPPPPPQVGGPPPSFGEHDAPGGQEQSELGGGGAVGGKVSPQLARVPANCGVFITIPGGPF